MRLDDDTRRRLIRARDVLEETSLTIDEIARGAGISSSHFIRVFAATFGVTPHQLRIATRLDRAKGLLVRGASVTEACVEVGFTSVGSFSALFMQRTGLSPSAWRRRVVQVPESLRRPGCLSLMELAFRSFREA